uniref:Uncharacterized protein n=1 Tax=Pyxicephalus adspersus TaxID=30357 RepID=A0AAV3AGU7_PYXAD|nr:TPA: hypothetical protein GDO54_013426 [Pyxicephalus adspersus]
MVTITFSHAPVNKGSLNWADLKPAPIHPCLCVNQRGRNFPQSDIIIPEPAHSPTAGPILRCESGRVVFRETTRYLPEPAIHMEDMVHGSGRCAQPLPPKNSL